MKIALASPPYPKSVEDGLRWLEKLTREAAERQAEIICFPETYIPGYPAGESETRKPDPQELEDAFLKACKIAHEYGIAIILPMDWYENDVLFNVAHVISNTGESLGYQTKNQLDPSEDAIWVSGKKRIVFEVKGVKFGISICHEGFRYPETVRWAARNGARIVFHPHFAGSDISGFRPVEWGSMANPYYEKAMMMRALENTIYFASSNCCFNYPESASSIIDPQGRCIAFQPYGEPGVLIADIDLQAATGFLAKRLKNELYF